MWNNSCCPDLFSQDIYTHNRNIENRTNALMSSVSHKMIKESDPALLCYDKNRNLQLKMNILISLQFQE